jgi:fucose 4-O-acetylase-like acetyltransferase
MTDATTRADRPALDLSKRDLTLDLARVFCVLLVVVIHLLMTGVIVDARGIGLQRTLELQPWYAHATWFGQIMPLFFVIGGFAGLTAWRSVQRRGGDARGYVKSRVLRLARPAFPLFVFYIVAIGAGLLIVMTTGLLGFRVLDGVIIGAGSPLWFIAAYAISQAFLPVLARLHATAPKRTVLVLLVAVILVDALRYSTAEALGVGSFWLGLLNLLFVWPLIQQFGFWYADGFFDRPWWQLVLICAFGFGMLWPLTTYGPYSVDMLVNQNPPTLPLVFIGLAQAAFLRLLKRPLSALMRTRAAQGVVFVAGTRLITIYLWHVPMIVLVAGLALLIPGASPRPGSAEWWWSRPIEFVILLVLLYALSFLVGRFEQPPEPGHSPPAPIVAVAVALVVAVPTIMIPLGLDFVLAIAGAITFGLAILLLERRAPRAPRS